MLTQITQSAVCNQFHSVEARLARWLLMVRDRIDSDDIPVTQEFLSMMLGVRRSGVSVAASALQARGLIRQHRGHITITNRTGLEGAACRCYGAIARNQARILPP